MVIPLTVPLTSELPDEGKSVTFCPMSDTACIVCKSVCVLCAVCKALNWASCAAKSVSLSGLSGSWELICVTSKFKKSA